jgi:hypothetical protein
LNLDANEGVVVFHHHYHHRQELWEYFGVGNPTATNLLETVLDNGVPTILDIASPMSKCDQDLVASRQTSWDVEVVVSGKRNRVDGNGVGEIQVAFGVGWPIRREWGHEARHDSCENNM